MKDLENGKKSAQLLMQKVPHIIPHKERVVLFRKYVNNEKTVLGLTESACASPQSTLITVHRSRVVEDGYQQLAMQPSQSLKGVIRVKFINEQGLDEAGIDQVFSDATVCLKLQFIIFFFNKYFLGWRL